MGAVDPTGAFNHRGGQHAGFAEAFQRNAGADNVDDGVHRTNLVKVHFVRRHAVHLALGLGHATEHRDRLFLHPVTERTVVDDFFYVGKVALVRMPIAVVAVGMRMRVLMRMGMLVAVAMLV